MVSKELHGGFTNNRVMRHDRFVVKYGDTVKKEYDWYRAYQEKSDIPRIYSCNTGALTMDFIEQDGLFSIDKIIEIVERYKNYPVIGGHQFSEYVTRIEQHLNANKIYGADKLINKLNQCSLWPTFSHGDLSIRNIIPTKDGLKLIDPLYGDRFGSYILDYAKLAFTLKFYDGNLMAYNELMACVQIPKVLIATECVRVATYRKQFNFIAENLINELT